ncbi:MAG TPA: sigma 54-interacting transcriptional regulator, partial [bacterium]|nr:sigma 54-interacting transcriptional regulator [bacterium]
ETEQRLGELEASALNHPAAFVHLQASLGHFQTAGLRQSEAVIRQHLALLLRDYGRLPEASALMDQALDLSRDCGQFLQWTRYLANRALIDLDSANYGRALLGLEKAEKILSALGTEEDRWLLKLQRAELGLALGDREPPKLSEHPGFEDDLALLQAEWTYSRKRYPEAEALFLQSLNRAVHPRHRLAAGLGLIRSRARLGRLDLKAAELDSTLAMLDSLPGPRYQAWRLLLPLLGGGAPLTQSGGAIREALASLSRLVLPELKRELRELLALGLARAGLSRAAGALHRAIQNDFLAILSQLPEELQMDYEKNRAPLFLDEDLSALIGTPQTAPAQSQPPASPPATPDLPRLTEQRFRQYSQISRQIAQRNDLNEILERVMDAAIELTGAERGYLLLKNDSVKSKPLPGYEIKTARAFNHRSPDPEDLQISTTAVRQAIQRGSVLLTENALLDSELQQKKSVVQFQLKSILVTPLDLEGEIIGAIYLDHRYHPACFREEDVLFLGAFAAQAALAIQKAGLIAELRAAKEQLEKKVESQAKRIDDLSGELAQVRDQLKYGYEEIVGQSPAMMEVFHLLDHVTDTAIPVWIHGESGTGKELVARSLHVNSSRKAKPFVGENCSAIPDTLLESELFGHKRGAFTHADRDRVGLFERADGGTLFLDEVADM